MTASHFDLTVVGAGILGLAQALAAARRGLRVGVLDGHARANGSLMCSFGSAMDTGQKPGMCGRRVRMSRGVWDNVLAAAAIEALHRRPVVAARRPATSRDVRRKDRGWVPRLRRARHRRTSHKRSLRGGE
ncbi:MAG: FAD-dependent oxidoreductase [Pseudomonadota bacterium]